jgi:geranylgeranyl pyrophosphate synthase
VKNMSLSKAQEIVTEVVAGRKRLGKQFVPRQIMDDVLDALVVVHDNANLDAPSKDEITKLKRQLAACQNREKARQNKDLEPGNENQFSGDRDTAVYMGANGEAKVVVAGTESTSEG